jgi:hypothetical protein
MNRFFASALIVASLSVPAFAAKNSQSVTLTDPVKVGSTQLPAGNYKVSWTANGSTAQVTIEEKGKASVTVPAKIVESKNGHVAVLTNTVGGVAVLESIQLNNLSLVLSGGAAAGE